MRSSTTAGPLLVTLAGVAFVVCLASFALKLTGVGVTAASVTLLAAGGAMSWLTTESRRRRDVQRRWDTAARSVTH